LAFPLWHSIFLKRLNRIVLAALVLAILLYGSSLYAQHLGAQRTRFLVTTLPEGRERDRSDNKPVQAFPGIFLIWYPDRHLGPSHNRFASPVETG